MFRIGSWNARNRGNTGTGGTGRGEAPTGTELARDTLRQQLEEIEWLTRWFFYCIIAFTFFYSVAEAWRLNHVDVLVFDFGVLLGLTAASSVVGGLLGFLFGIPRTIQSGAASTPASAGQQTAEGGG